MRAKALSIFLLTALAGGTARAQSDRVEPDPSSIYCSGMVAPDVPGDTYLITGEQSNHRITFQQGDLVYINRGASQGVKVGDQFQVQRAVKDELAFRWFKQQPSLLRAMGKVWADLGRLRVVNVHANVSVAEIVFSCGYMQRGDIVLPYQEREAPQFKAAADFDLFAPPSGKATGMVVIGKDFAQPSGNGDIVYVNLGTAQGIRVGDYLRIFRYQGIYYDTAFHTRNQALQVYGYGSSPARYRWDNLPREVLGEGIVLRVTPTATTLLVTKSRREIYSGDYVELQ